MLPQSLSIKTTFQGQQLPKDVLKKWLTDNSIVATHLYNLQNDIAFEDFSKKVSEDDFRVEDNMKSF